MPPAHRALRARNPQTGLNGAPMLACAAVAGMILAGCASRPATVHYIVSTDSPYACCRTMRYDVMDFPDLTESRTPGDGVVVRIGADTLKTACGEELRMPVTIANNGDSDIYVPVSHELQGTTMKLYPWILHSIDDRRVRLARQIQYGDLLERTDSRLTFHRIPARMQVTLSGLVAREWLCKPEIILDATYLKDQLNPKYWSDHTRALRTPAYWNEPQPVLSEVGLRYDVVYTTLPLTRDLPVREENWNNRRDTVDLRLTGAEEPATYINESQQVAVSNIITVLIDQ